MTVGTDNLKPADSAPTIPVTGGGGWPVTAPDSIPSFTPSGAAINTPTGTGAVATTGNGTATVWNHKAWASIIPNTSDLNAIAAMSDTNSAFWNDWQTKTTANAGYTALPADQRAAFEGLATYLGNGRTGRGLYQDYVQQSAQYGAAGEQRTPYSLMIEQYPDAVSMGKSAAAAAAEAAYTGPTTQTYQTSAVNLTDPLTAKGLLSDTLTKYLGKEPSRQELSRFIGALHSYEQQNPTVENQTSTTTPDKANHSTSTVSSQQRTGGTDPTQFAEDWAKSQEGSAEYRAATEYMDMFLTAIKNPLDVV